MRHIRQFFLITFISPKCKVTLCRLFVFLQWVNLVAPEFTHSTMKLDFNLELNIQNKQEQINKLQAEARIK